MYQKEKKLNPVLLIVLAVVLLAVGIAVWFLLTHVRVAGTFYSRSAEVLDLRFADITTADYEKLRKKVPNSEILWRIPFQGKTYDQNTDVLYVAPGNGGTAEIAMSYTESPVHNEDYFVKLARELEQMGADVLCIKDMANLLLPMDAYSLVKRLKETVNMPIHLHTHNTSGTGDMVYLMATMAGVDIVDTALSPLANGTSQPATESLVATLKGTVRDTGLDLDKMSEAAIHFRKVAEQLKASGALDPKVLNVDTNTLLYQVPGGMLSNLISQLKQAGKEDKYYDVLAEIPRVREDFGYPPLVTPSSQIVGTQAVLNIITGERYKMVPKESKAMLRGEYGKLPGTVNEDVRAKAGIKPEEVITCRPADLLEPELPKYREEFKDLARSEEDVLSLALFPQVAPAFINRRNLRTPKAHRTMAPIAHSAKHERAVAPFSRK